MEQDIIFCIHHAVKEIAKTAKEDVVEGDYDLNGGKSVYDLSRGDTSKGEKERKFQFKDYAAHAFHHIRSLFGYTPESFLQSWELETDNKLELSTARSGSMFYRTKDKKFLFKTILHPEVAVMMELLKDYHNHAKTHKGTFMVKIYGLFRFQYEGKGDKVWILIMGNTFPPGVKVDEVYDLKGRASKPGKSPSERERVSTGAIKDNEITRIFALRGADKDFYKLQLVTDITLLMRHNIMDYSLLVGVHKLTEEEKEYKNRKLNALNQKSEITITVNDSSAETTPSSSVASEISTKSKAKREKSDNSLNIVVSTSPRGKKSKKDGAMQPSLSEGTLITKDKKTSSSRNPKTESKSSKKEEKKDEKSKEEKSGEKTGKKDEEKSAEKPKKEEVKEDTSKKTENSPTEEKENKESDKKEGKSEGDKPRKSKSTKSAKKEAKEPKSEEPKSEEPKEEKKINQEQVELLKLEQQFTSQAIEKKNATAADLMALEQLYTAKSTPRLREEKKEVENGEKKESENPGIKITDEVKIDEKELSKDTDSLKSAKSKKLNKSFLSINIDTKETQECFEKHSAQFKALLDEPDNPAAECFKYGGLFCTSPEGEEEILYLGIIDNLTGFGFNKKVANFCKSFLWDEDTLSTVRAEFYKERFEKFMCYVLIGDDVAVPSEEQQFQNLENKGKTSNKSTKSLGAPLQKKNGDLKASASSPMLSKKKQDQSI